MYNILRDWMKLKRCKRYGRRTISVNIGDKNLRKSEADKSVVFLIL
jgi:hypothetical protein